MKKLIVLLTLMSFSIFGMSISNSKTGISLEIDKVAEGYKFTVTAPTDGWVGIGFEPSFIMKNAEYIMLSHVGDKGEIYHFFGTGEISISPIESLVSTYKNDNLTLQSFSHDGKTSTYVFVRTEKVKNEYIKNLTAGKKVKILFAYSKDPEINKKHKKTSSETITLPN